VKWKNKNIIITAVLFILISILLGMSLRWVYIQEKKLESTLDQTLNRLEVFAFQNNYN